MSGAISAISVAGAAAGAAGAGTAGIAGAALAANAGAIGLISTGISAFGAIEQGRQASQSAKYNAAIQSNNAQLATQNATLAAHEGEANAGIEQQKTRAQIGAIKSAQAANNIDVNSGSAVDVRSSAAELGELNAINIRSQAARTAYGYQTSAASDKAQAALDKQQASYDSAAGVVKGATTLIGGAAAGAQSGAYDAWLNNGSLNGGTSAAENNFMSKAYMSGGGTGP